MTAALLSSLASQPGDTLLSAVNKQTRARVVQSQNDSPSNINTVQIMKESIMELGLTGLFTGTKARLLHVGVIVVVQLVVYDYIKQLCGIPLSH
jgi:predicted transcriptional regulator YheO